MTTDLEKVDVKPDFPSKQKRKLGFSSLPYKKQKIIISILFLMVPVVLLAVFTYLPAISMAGYSFTDWDGISKVKNFVGLKNYQTILSDPKYFQPLFVSIYYLIASFIQIALGVGVAYLVSFGCKASNLFKSVYFFPSLINSVAIGFIFIFFLQPGSTLDTVLSFLHLDGLINYWLQDPKFINVSIALTGALSAFETPYIMTGGGNGSMTFIIQTVNYAFQNHRVGLASAMAMILLILCILIISIQKLVFRNKEV